MKRESGFTLAELLVALAVAGLVVAAAQSLLGTLGDFSRRSQAARDPVLRGAAARSALTAWFRAAQRPDSLLHFLGRHGSVGGEAVDELAFTIEDGGRLWSGPHRVHLWVDRDPQTPRQGLLAAMTPLYSGGAAPAETLSLAVQATGLAIRYKIIDNGRERWVSEWQSDWQLPLAAELHVTRLGRVRLGAVDENALPPLIDLPMVLPMGAEAW